MGTVVQIWKTLGNASFASETPWNTNEVYLFFGYGLGTKKAIDTRLQLRLPPGVP
jgi:hypothetical protein